MSATVTLPTTTLTLPLLAGDSVMTVASTANLNSTPTSPLFGYLDRELVRIERLLPVGTQVRIQRGMDGTVAAPHSAGAVLTIGRADQFYSQDPVVVPPGGVALVSPYINVLTGVSWVVRGDQIGPGVTGQSWQPVTVPQTAGALGVRVNTTITPI